MTSSTNAASLRDAHAREKGVTWRRWKLLLCACVVVCGTLVAVHTQVRKEQTALENKDNRGFHIISFESASTLQEGASLVTRPTPLPIPQLRGSRTRWIVVLSGARDLGPGTSGPGASGPGASGAGAPGAGASDPGTSGSGVSGPGTSGPGASGPGASGPGASGAAAPGAGPSGARDYCRDVAPNCGGWTVLVVRPRHANTSR